MAPVRFLVLLLPLLLLADGSSAQEKDLSVSELLWRANKDVVHTEEEPLVMDDIAYDSEKERNADPCTSGGCMWSKSGDGKVYVPFVIASHYSSRERAIIERGLQSFSSVSCIRFVPRSGQRDYLSIQSHNGCYSYLGRRGNGQAVSLDRQGCLYHSTVQHELLHALGFNHEQCRSDRDQHIRVLWHNIQPGWEYAFDKVNTLNMNTPYDYNSVMQYHRFAFSGNNMPTMEPIPNANVEFGTATEMSRNDIDRLNRLYKLFVDVKMKFLPALVLLLAVSAWAEEVTEELTTSEKIERVNKNAGTRFKTCLQRQKYAFSKNGQATMQAIPNSNVQFGSATEVSQNDITRLNRLLSDTTHSFREAAIFVFILIIVIMAVFPELFINSTCFT
ncbi:uncharacterized protein V6R79_004482 [Siganus canaliculatus]